MTGARAVAAHGILGLQRHVGNHVVARLLQPPPAVIQRHSTHEHYLLGSLPADKLADIPSIREQHAQGDATNTPKRKAVTHLLKQEMKRLLTWQHQGPESQLATQHAKFGARIGKVKKVHNEWQVPYVEIPTQGGSTVICTYGELNTLADMFGNLKDLKDARPEVVVGMLQGVRQRVYITLHKLLQEVDVSGEQLVSEVEWLRPGTSFEGAMGFTGKEKTPVGKLMALKGYDFATREGGSGAKYPFNGGEATESNASAALARNACHFAPETWHTWRRYHERARELAGDAQLARILVHTDPANKRVHEERARELTNEALLHSGFGDHYLQDAYASGHLIDKTLIMQWMVQWLNDTGRARRATDWSMISAMAKQQLRSNPQMMENVGGGISARLQEMGVQSQAEIRLLMWWRREAARNADHRTMTPQQMLQFALPGSNFPVSGISVANDFLPLLNSLVSMGFVNASAKHGRFTLDQAHVDVLTGGKKAPYRARTAVPLVAPPDYEREAQEFNYEALTMFLDSTYVQKMTNFLHDKFCAEGLDVSERRRRTDRRDLRRRSDALSRRTARRPALGRDGADGSRGDLHHSLDAVWKPVQLGAVSGGDRSPISSQGPPAHWRQGARRLEQGARTGMHTCGRPVQPGHQRASSRPPPSASRCSCTWPTAPHSLRPTQSSRPKAPARPNSHCPTHSSKITAVRMRQLGSSGLSLSVVGFGAWAAAGGRWLHGLGPQDDAESMAAILRAVEGGVNWIDTAPLYGRGHSEEVVGAALRQLPASDRPYVFTKCSADWTDDGDVAATASLADIPSRLDDSLRRLGVERVDLLQIHAPRWYADVLDETWQVLLDLKASGKIRYTGVSNFSVAQLETCEALGHVDSLQPSFSAIKREAAAELLPWCAAHGTGVIVYSPMESGLLSGTYTEERVASLPDIDVRKHGRPEFAQPRLSRNVALGRALHDLAKRRGVPTPALAVAWTLAWPGVSGAIVGARRPAHVDDWLSAGDLELDAAELDAIAQAIAATGAGQGPTRP